MKTLKNLVLAASIYALTTACGQTNPSPESKVAVTPPTPVTNKCDNVKNPLEDVDWLKEFVVYFKSSKEVGTITQYTYKGKPIYEAVSSQCSFIGNCDRSIKVSSGLCGIGAVQQGSYTEITQNITNPVLLFEKK
jgi:hypothetical protein